MADDDCRVEPRQSLVGRGIGTTPERIADLQRQADGAAKLNRPKPVRRFADVMAKGAKARGEEILSVKEKKLRALPKKGPRPALLHPAQRDAYGREEDSDEEVVIKG